VTAPVRPPGDTHLECMAHATPVVCEDFTQGWAHLLAEHSDGNGGATFPESWKLIGTQPS